MSIGERLKSARHERHMTLAQLAEASDLTKGFLSQVERGHSLPSLGSLHRLSSALDMPVESFVAGEAHQRGGTVSSATRAHVHTGILSPHQESPQSPLARVAGAEVSLLALEPGQRLSLDLTLKGDSFADGTAFCLVLSGT